MSESNFFLIIERGMEREIVNIPYGASINICALRYMIEQGLITDRLEEIDTVSTLTTYDGRMEIYGGEAEAVDVRIIEPAREAKTLVILKQSKDPMRTVATSDEGLITPPGGEPGPFVLVAKRASSFRMSPPFDVQWAGAYQSLMARIIKDNEDLFKPGTYESLTVFHAPSGYSMWTQDDVLVEVETVEAVPAQVEVTRG